MPTEPTGKHAPLGAAIVIQIVAVVVGGGLLLWGAQAIVVRALRFLLYGGSS